MSLRFEIFPSDLDATVDFYTRVLRFQVNVDRRLDPEPYVQLQRDGVLVGAARRADVPDVAVRRPPTGVELVLEVDDIDAEYAYVVGTGWPRDAELVLRQWGLRDFRLLDPAGHLLRLTDRQAG
jgi:lactoylglutathione lyase